MPIFRRIILILVNIILVTVQEDVRSAYVAVNRKVAPADAMWEQLVVNETYRNEVKLDAAYIRQKGLTHVPSLIFNGKIYTQKDAEGGSLVELCLALIDDEAQQLGSMIQGGKLTDRQNALEVLISEEGFEKYNAKILSSTHLRQVYGFPSLVPFCNVGFTFHHANSLQFCGAFEG